MKSVKINSFYNNIPYSIGGYFKLELCDLPLKNFGLLFQSARAALASLLLQSHVVCVWVPQFICNTLIFELQRIGIEVRKYNLQENLSPSNKLNPGKNEIVLLVNYFGVCGPQIGEALKRLPRERCVLDNSQAFFMPPGDCLGTIYSPRKFFGVPDGGILMTEYNVQPPSERDDQSMFRCEHLLSRYDRLPEKGLEAYRRAERSLSDVPHRRMSHLTERLLNSIDYYQASLQRQANFHALHRLFSMNNKMPLQLDQISSPLTYPLWLSNEASQIREALIQHRVFSPTYWPEFLEEEPTDAQAAKLTREIVHIPIDHRYDPEQIEQKLRKIPKISSLMAY